MSIQVVEQKVKDMVNKQELFTSVDVANAVKKDGVWVRNKNVAKLLRNFDFDSVSYEKSVIDVDGGRKATVYYPSFSDPDHYTDRSQKALTPDDVKANLPNGPIATDDDEEEEDKDDSNVVKEKRVCSVKKIRIPAKFVKKLKLRPGMKVKADRVNVDRILSKPLSNRLRVNADGRITISSGSLRNGNSKITICLMDNNTIKLT